MLTEYEIRADNTQWVKQLKRAPNMVKLT